MSFEVRFLFTFVAAVLACYRLAQAFALDEVFQPLRGFFGVRAAGGNPVWRGIAYLSNCPFCIGFWLALPLSFIVAKPVNLVELFLMWFAVAGGQAFLESQRK